ncbi:tRNA pseudouridine(13) synthase TruD [Persephonella sp.]
MKKIHFNIDFKSKPEDFIVMEVSDIPEYKDGEHFLYLLIKRNLTTKEISKIYNLSYAGLKDKKAVTFQYVSSHYNLGNIKKEKVNNESFYILLFLKKIKKKLKIGQLKGNKFSVRNKNFKIKKLDWFINYYDTQRIEKNWYKGKKIFEKSYNKSWKNLTWVENFLIDSYLSYLWNLSLLQYIRLNYQGYILSDKGFDFFIPDTDYRELFNNIQKFWPILGYKVKLNETEEEIYKKILNSEGFSLDEFIFKLKTLKIKGTYRKTFLKVQNFKLNKNRIEFFIEKGGYGTMYLKHLIEVK